MASNLSISVTQYVSSIADWAAQILAPQNYGTLGTNSSGAPQLIANNFLAIVAPTTGNDNTQGYGIGSMWLNTVTTALYLCTSSATGAATWVQVGGGSSKPIFVGTVSMTQGVGTVQVSGLGLPSIPQNVTGTCWCASPGGDTIGATVIDTSRSTDGFTFQLTALPSLTTSKLTYMYTL